MKRIIEFRNAGFAYRDPPPRYTEEDVNDRRYVEAEVPTKRYTEAEENNKRAVEVAAPPPNPFFEPVERQRHFGILRYTVNNRFRKLMIIGICNFILITLVLLIIGFLVFEFGFKHKGTATPSTTTMKVQIRTAIKQITTKPVSTGSTTTSRATKGDTTTVTTTSTSSSTGTSSTTTSSSTVTTTTTQPTTSTKKIIEQSSNCSPLDQSTFLFSYSNDFDSATVLDAFNYFFERTGSDDHFNKLANIRFDMKTQDEFEFHSDWSDFQSSVQSNLPNTSLALFKTVGSDVLDMINRFLENDQVSICGSRIFVLTKRYPNEMDTTELVSKLRQFHVELTFVASRNSCGSWNPDVLCNLALRTNGHTFFDDDDQIFYFDYNIKKNNSYIVSSCFLYFKNHYSGFLNGKFKYNKRM
uniref:SEA domain-containing protein n=1 Tax=Caenorhabditis tropicalis TaxID=1561998 RepID=A0A1I7TTT3_9PELO